MLSWCGGWFGRLISADFAISWVWPGCRKCFIIVQQWYWETMSQDESDKLSLFHRKSVAFHFKLCEGYGMVLWQENTPDPEMATGSHRPLHMVKQCVKHINDTYRICILDYVEFDVVEITHLSWQDSVEAEVSFGYFCAVSIVSSSFVLHFQ